MLDQFFDTAMTLGFSDSDIPLLAIGGGLTVGVIGIVFGTVSSMFNKRQQEQTKREIAAYVAEGSITPADAERIIASSPKT